MGLFSNMTLNTLDDLFVVQLHDLYDAEQRLTKALPKMAEAASNNKLRWAFKNHLEETKQHIARLEKAFDALGLTPKRETCEAMKGLIAEGEEAINADGESDVKDAALIAAAQRVEHYEIAGYGSSGPSRNNSAIRKSAEPAANPGRRVWRRRDADTDRHVVGKRKRGGSLIGRLARDGTDAIVGQFMSHDLRQFNKQRLFQIPSTRPVESPAILHAFNARADRAC